MAKKKAAKKKGPEIRFRTRIEILKARHEGTETLG
jgi:hypothetical protein